MSKFVYCVEVNGAYHAYVKADTVTEAKRVALQHVTTRRLDAGEIIDLVNRGIAICEATVDPTKTPSEDEE